MAQNKKRKWLGLTSLSVLLHGLALLIVLSMSDSVPRPAIRYMTLNPYYSMQESQSQQQKHQNRYANKNPISKNTKIQSKTPGLAPGSIQNQNETNHDASTHEAATKDGSKADSAASSKISSTAFNQIQKRILNYLEYPNYLQKRGIEGTAEVQFILLPNGAIEGLALTQTSGSSDLDGLALKAVAQASPFPRTEESRQNQERLKIHLPIQFKLK